MKASWLALIAVFSWIGTAEAQPVTGMVQRGEQALAAGDVGLAIELLERAVRIDPNDALAQFYLGRAVLRLNPVDVVRARRHFERAAELAPTSDAGIEAVVELRQLRQAEQTAAAEAERRRLAEAAAAEQHRLANQTLIANVDRARAMFLRQTRGSVLRMCSESIDSFSQYSKFVLVSDRYSDVWNIGTNIPRTSEWSISQSQMQGGRLTEPLVWRFSGSFYDIFDPQITVSAAAHGDSGGTIEVSGLRWVVRRRGAADSEVTRSRLSFNSNEISLSVRSGESDLSFGRNARLCPRDPAGHAQDSLRVPQALQLFSFVSSENWCHANGGATLMALRVSSTGVSLAGRELGAGTLSYLETFQRPGDGGRGPTEMLHAYWRISGARGQDVSYLVMVLNRVPEQQPRLQAWGQGYASVEFYRIFFSSDPPEERRQGLAILRTFC
jgi:hypothetical protein